MLNPPKPPPSKQEVVQYAAQVFLRENGRTLAIVATFVAGAIFGAAVQ